MFDVTGGQEKGQGTFLSQEVRRLSFKNSIFFEFNIPILTRCTAVSDCLTD